MVKIRIFASFTVILILTLLFVNCTEDSPTTPSIDFVAPYVEWVNLSNSAELSGTVEFSFSVYDENGIDSVKVYINGLLDQGWGRHSCLTSCSDTTIAFAWNTLDYEDGVYILEARAWDTSGNLGVSPFLMVNVRNNEEPPPDDHLPPMIIWVSPEASSEVSGDVTLRFNAMDNIGIDSLKLYVNGACPEGFTLQGQQEIEYSIVWNTEDFGDGVYSLEARAWDTSGNMGTSPSLMVNVKNDTDPPPEDRLAPYVHWIAPEGGSTLKDTVSLQVGLYDENGVDSLKVYINGTLIMGSAGASPPAAQSVRKCTKSLTMSFPRRRESNNNNELTDSCLRRNDTLFSSRTGLLIGGNKGEIKGGFNLTTSTDTTITIAWNTFDYEDGVYILEARAWDTSGNLGTSPSLMVNVKNDEEPPPEDRTPPVVSWVSPEPGTEVSGDVELCFQVMDDIGLDSVQVYLNSQKWQNFKYIENYFDTKVIWITSDYSDNNYIVEVRAWDTSGNIGSSEVICFTVRNNVPRVIWVPDDYETIQGAINASEDGDTVRVRAGIYYGMVYFWDKDIWLESEMGPELTIIDADNDNFGVRIDNGQDTTTTIRGFMIMNAEFRGIDLVYNSSIRMFNNIVITPEGKNVWSDFNRSIYLNNIFTNSGSGNFEIWVSYGYMYNNLVIHSGRYAMFNRSYFDNPLFIDYNLFWDYQTLLTNEPSFRFEENNIFDLDPQFRDDSFILRNNSPCIDTGHPDLFDLDGSRSDMGVYGGQYAYPPP
ncbi:hypothetical protein K9N50_01140 [bacterium]|nr:hypothetical protein [bacterium]